MKKAFYTDPLKLSFYLTTKKEYQDAMLNNYKKSTQVHRDISQEIFVSDERDKNNKGSTKYLSECLRLWFDYLTRDV